MEHVADGKLAQERLKGGTVPFLICLLDMHLPHVSGGELLTRMKQDERFANTIMILTTADVAYGRGLYDQADFLGYDQTYFLRPIARPDQPPKAEALMILKKTIKQCCSVQKPIASCPSFDHSHCQEGARKTRTGRITQIAVEPKIMSKAGKL